jgi:hypothetical protein
MIHCVNMRCHHEYEPSVGVISLEPLGRTSLTGRLRLSGVPEVPCPIEPRRHDDGLAAGSTIPVIHASMGLHDVVRRHAGCGPEPAGLAVLENPVAQPTVVSGLPRAMFREMLRVCGVLGSLAAHYA